MWLLTLLNWWKTYRLERLSLQQQRYLTPFTTLQQIVDKMGETQQSQNRIFQEWMRGFQTSTVPTSSNVREIDEWKQEQVRASQNDNEWVPLDLGSLPSIEDMMNDLDRKDQ